MTHKFDIMIDGKIQTFTRFEDIPNAIDCVISFVPEIPPGPHTHEQHEEIDQWQHRFDQLMERASATSSKAR